ncbi:hypothetical protein JCM8097_005648 [Rhodosporidiobolus ruineniae]
MQFEDADEDALLAAPLAPAHTAPVDFSTPRAVSGPFVDDDDLDSLPEEDEDDDDEEDWPSEDEWEQQRTLRAGLNDVLDQDWADASGDFTKRYNRLKQQVLVSHGAAPGKVGSSSAAPTTVLPAMNRSRRPPPPPAASSSSSSAPLKAGDKEAVHGDKVSDQLAYYSRFASRIQLDPLGGGGTGGVGGAATRKGGSEKILVKDKSDRATNEQVLDPRTRLILFKMLGRGLIERIDGCVSTGKEANVYHAISPEGKHLALKIYKTSILVFKDRDRYVTGEFRFKNGYAKSNPRKMVRLWAEKELRNLKRMRQAGMRVPEAVEVRENVLVMDFVSQGDGGEDEWQASPRLKDAQIPPEQHHALYVEILVILRVIFHRCRLVHADFSEYNILYHEGHLWVIDVSQSIEHEHPSAFDFLRADIKNADDFFARRGIDTLGLTRTFNFVTRDSWLPAGEEETDDKIAEEVERLLSQAEKDDAAAAAEAEAHQRAGTQAPQRTTESDEAVFAQAYIPRTLEQVYDVERDVQRVLRGEGKDLIYAELTGVAGVRKGAEKEKAGKGEKEKGVKFEGEGEGGDGEEDEEGSSDEEDGSEGEEDSEEDDGEGEDGDKERRPRGKKFEDKEEKKKRRQETKEAAREKRTTKMKKSEKARRVKKGSGKKR